MGGNSWLEIGPRPGILPTPHPLVVAQNQNCTPDGRMRPLTKVIATVGPACDSEEALTGMQAEGVTGIRINTSHYNPKDPDDIRRIHQTAFLAHFTAGVIGRPVVPSAGHYPGRRVKVFIDLPGFELRCRVNKKQEIPLPVGTKVRIAFREGASRVENDGMVTIHIEGSHPYNPVEDIGANRERYPATPPPHLLINDGEMVVALNWPDFLDRDRPQTDILGTVIGGGILTNGRKLNIPMHLPNLPAVTDADHAFLRQCFDMQLLKTHLLDFTEGRPDMRRVVDNAMAAGLLHTLGPDDYASSFIRSRKDAATYAELALKYAGPLRVGQIIKAETAEASEAIAEILSLDSVIAVMIARGDLYCEAPMESGPMYERKMITAARAIMKSAILATHVLTSMKDGAIRPKPLEVKDVADAILRGISATQLSNETAVGKNPVAMVRFLLDLMVHPHMERDILHSPERLALQAAIRQRRDEDFQRIARDRSIPIEERKQTALYNELAEIGREWPLARGLVLWSKRGRSIDVAEQALLGIPIFLMTDSEAVYKKSLLQLGVFPMLLSRQPTSSEFEEIAKRHIFASPGKNSMLRTVHNLST